MRRAENVSKIIAKILKRKAHLMRSGILGVVGESRIDSGSIGLGSVFHAWRLQGSQLRGNVVQLFLKKSCGVFVGRSEARFITNNAMFAKCCQKRVALRKWKKENEPEQFA